MKNFIVSSRIFEDKNGAICTSYDLDILEMLHKLDILMIPISASKKINNNLLKNSHGLFLMGGGNINIIEKKKINKIRDDFEKKLFRYFIKQDKPIIGICRGFQNIVSFYGIKPFQVKDHVRTSHHIKINNSRFIKSKSLNVNSYHNYAVKNLPKNYSAISKLRDGTIEIAEHKTKNILCLMFHPERKMPSQRKIMQVLKNFIK
jgi:N5-(cytidine 5'-diphosphoramidyl)-L-glutamine hydrolase